MNGINASHSPHSLIIYERGDLPAGTFFLLAGGSAGPGDMRLHLQVEVPGGWSDVAVWTFQGDNQIRTFGTVLPFTGKYSLLAETDSTQNTPVFYRFSHEAWDNTLVDPEEILDVATVADPGFHNDAKACRCLPVFHPPPAETPSLAVVDAWASGPLAVKWHEARAHFVDITVYERDGSGRVWPDDFSVVATSHSTPDAATAAQVHALEWDAEEGGLYYIVAASQDDPGALDRTASPLEGRGYTTFFHFLTVPEDPSQGAPLPLWTAVAALMAALVIARRRK